MTFPLDLPEGADLRELRLAERFVQAVSENPFSLVEDVFDWPGQRWEAELVLRPLQRDGMAAWSVWFSKLGGRAGSFLLGDPLRSTPRGTPAGTPLIKTAGQTGTALVTDGWTPEAAGVLKADDRIQIGAGLGARLHKVLEDVSADANGEATLSLWPAIFFPHDADTPITTTNARGLFRLAQSSLDQVERRRAFHEDVRFRAYSVIASPV